MVAIHAEHQLEQQVAPLQEDGGSQLHRLKFSASLVVNLSPVPLVGLASRAVAVLQLGLLLVLRVGGVALVLVVSLALVVQERLAPLAGPKYRVDAVLVVELPRALRVGDASRVLPQLAV